jgi:AraC-like DNA-binding protein
LAASAQRIPARYFAQFLDCVESAGVSRDEVLRAARLRDFDDPRAQLTLGKVESLIAAAEQLTGRSDLGFDLGLRLKTTSHDVLGYALLTSPTFRDALRLLANYQRLINPAFSLRLEHRGSRVDLVYRPAMPLSHRAMRTFQEAISVSNDHEFAAMLRHELPPYDLYLSIERPAHADRYRELRGARVHWGEPLPGLRMSLDSALLGMSLPMADPRAMQAAEERCAALLRGGGRRRRWSEWCRTMLREAEDCQPTLEQLARFLNISPRTLARYLEQEGTGFRQLALDVRTRRARDLLAAGKESVTRIAYRLGYSDVASFIRCFRGRTGVTPAALRGRRSGRDARHQVRDVRGAGLRQRRQVVSALER